MNPKQQQALEELRVVVKEAGAKQWREGDLIIVIAGPFVPGENQREVVSLVADDVGVDYPTLESYRQVATAWPPATRDDSIPWTCFRDLWRRDDRFDVMLGFVAYCRANNIKSNHYRKLQAFDGRKPTSEFVSERAAEQAGLALEKMTPSETARLIGQAARQQPEAFREAFRSSTEVRLALSSAQFEAAREHNSRLEGLTNNDPTLRGMAQRDALDDLTQVCTVFTMRVEQILPRLGELPGEEEKGLNLGANRMLTAALDSASDALSRAKVFIRGGRSDIDNFVNSVLKGDAH